MPRVYAKHPYFVLYVSVLKPRRPQYFFKRARNSTLARPNLDFAAGTETPNRAATSGMGNRSTSLSNMTFLNSGGIREISFWSKYSNSSSPSVSSGPGT